MNILENLCREIGYFGDVHSDDFEKSVYTHYRALVARFHPDNNLERGRVYYSKEMAKINQIYVLILAVIDRERLWQKSCQNQLNNS